MNEDLDDKLDRIESLIRIHRCEVAALLHEVVELSSRVRILLETAVTEPRIPKGMIEVPDSFLRFMEHRKEYLQRDLENLETSEPRRAARLQEILDEYDGGFGYF